MGLTAECSAELQGVRARMMKLRGEVDSANEKVENLNKQLQQLSAKQHETEEERNALQRQSVLLNDQLFNAESQLQDAIHRQKEVDNEKEALINEVKGLQQRLNMMDLAEENLKLQLHESRDKWDSAETELTELRRNVARYQMETEKMERDIALLRENNSLLSQALKEVEDRNAELTSSYNLLVMENKHSKGSHQHRQLQQHPIHDTYQDNQAEIVNLQKAMELDYAYKELDNREKIIEKLQQEITIYQTNNKIITDQLLDFQKANTDLKQQMAGRGQLGNVPAAVQPLDDYKEQLENINKQLTDAEVRGSQYEAENLKLKMMVKELEKQLNLQKLAYGQLCAQLNPSYSGVPQGAQE